MTENLMAWKVFEKNCESNHQMVQIQGINEISFDIDETDITFKIGYKEQEDVFYIKKLVKYEEQTSKEDKGYENLYSWLSLINSH